MSPQAWWFTAGMLIVIGFLAGLGAMEDGWPGAVFMVVGMAVMLTIVGAAIFCFAMAAG